MDLRDSDNFGNTHMDLARNFPIDFIMNNWIFIKPKYNQDRMFLIKNKIPEKSKVVLLTRQNVDDDYLSFWTSKLNTPYISIYNDTGVQIKGQRHICLVIIGDITSYRERYLAEIIRKLNPCYIIGFTSVNRDCFANVKIVQI